MVKQRSETNAVGNTKYPDLNMSQYPAVIDSKQPGAVGYNTNMKGFFSAGDPDLPEGTNPDYSMAEHVNALADAIMSVQRILGINPHVDKNGGNTEGTVGTRITAVEDRELYYDKRYGGENWTPALNQRILTHTHGGGLYEAPQINLKDEITGLLDKSFLDLSATTGLTGADLLMSPSLSTKVADAVNDKLSTSQGGTIEKNLTVKGNLSSRMHREFTAEVDAIGGTLQVDGGTSTGKAKRYSGTNSAGILNTSLKNFLAGKYIVGIRAKTSSRVSSEVLKVVFTPVTGNAITNMLSIKGSDFTTAGKWQQFYMVLDNEPSDTTGSGNNTFVAMRTATSSSVDIDFDYLYITPAHPGILDK